MLRRLLQRSGGAVAPVACGPSPSTSASISSSIGSRRALSSRSVIASSSHGSSGNTPTTHRCSSPSPSSGLDALTERLSRITLLSPALRGGSTSFLSTHARTAAAAAAPPPPPPPPPPPSASSALPANLILADPDAIAAFRPVGPEEIERRRLLLTGPVPPERLSLPVLPALALTDEGSSSSSEAAVVALDPRVFAVPVRRDIVHRLVVWQRAKRRLGLARTKHVGEIRGSTHKLRPQKGSGRARAGKKHAPQFRGGYKAHGPVERDFAHKLNKKVRAMGMRVALSAKAREGRVVVVEHLRLPEAKTRVLDKALRHHEWARNEDNEENVHPRRMLFLDGEALHTTMALACRNLPYAKALPQVGANAIDLLGAEVLILSREALEKLTARLLP